MAISTEIFKQITLLLSESSFLNRLFVLFLLDIRKRTANGDYGLQNPQLVIGERAPICSHMIAGMVLAGISASTG